MVLHEKASSIGLLQQMITWYLVVGKLIIIPALGHQNKGKSSFTGSALFNCKRPIEPRLHDNFLGTVPV